MLERFSNTLKQAAQYLCGGRPKSSKSLSAKRKQIAKVARRVAQGKTKIAEQSQMKELASSGIPRSVNLIRGTSSYTSSALTLLTLASSTVMVNGSLLYPSEMMEFSTDEGSASYVMLDFRNSLSTRIKDATLHSPCNITFSSGLIPIWLRLGKYLFAYNDADEGGKTAYFYQGRGTDFISSGLICLQKHLRTFPKLYKEGDIYRMGESSVTFATALQVLLLAMAVGLVLYRTIQKEEAQNRILKRSKKTVSWAVEAELEVTTKAVTALDKEKPKGILKRR